MRVSTHSHSALLLTLGALLLVSACDDDKLPPDYGGPIDQVPPGGGGSQDAGNNTDGGTGGTSDGGTFAARPSCATGSTSCAGACPDGGVVCAGNCGFLPAVTYSFSGTTDPEDIAVGDLNGDGFDDIVTANRQGNTVAVLLNRKGGLFQTPTMLATGAEPTSVLLSDLNGDQKLDILVANSGAKTFQVFPGKGDGTFQTATSYSFGMIVNDLAIGDFGGGTRSVAVLRGLLETLSLLKVEGNGTLREGGMSDVPTSPDSLVLEDFNLDGRLDIAMTHPPTCEPASASCQSVGVLLGKGDGTFQSQLFTPTGGLPKGIASLHLDTDTLPDLVVADAKGNQVLALRGAGTGVFYDPPLAYPAGKGAERLALADVDRDGRTDVLVSNSTENRVSLLLGRLDGSFSTQVPLVAHPQSTTWLQGLASSDFDKDGSKDVAVLTSSGVQMLWGICR